MVNKLVLQQFEQSHQSFGLVVPMIQRVIVSTVISGVLFAHFSTVECILTICSFLLTSLTAEARNKRESAALNAFYL